jgi:hypothetical protein
MYNAYAVGGLFVLTYRVCSRCRIPIDLMVLKTNELLQGLHFNLYMPLEFILFNDIQLRSWLYIVVLV